MGRGSRLALGAIAAAVAAGQVAPSHLGASIALATAAILLVAEARPRFGARALLPVACGAGLIAIRLAIVPAGPSPLATVPDGDGPWRLVVEATGSPRDGHQSATLATAPDAMPAFTVAATLPAYPVVTPGDLVTVDGSIRPRPDSPYGEYLLRIGAVGTLTSRSLAIGPAPDSPGRRLELLRRGAALALTRVLPEPEAGLAAGILIGLRDLVDRDLAAAFTTAGVSHVVAISGWNIAIVAAAIGAMTGRLGRRRRSVVTIVAIVLYVAFAGASASVVRAALMAGVVLLARETGRAGRAAAALGWAATHPARLGPGAHRRCRLPALVAGDGRADRLGDAAHRVARASRRRAGAGLAGREPRGLARRAGGDPADHPRLVRPAGGPVAARQPRSSCRSSRRRWRPASLALAGGVAVVAGAPPVLGTVVAAPGWVVLRFLVAIVDTAASLPFASVTLQPPLDTAAAALSVAAIAGATWWRRRRRAGVAEPTSPSIASHGTAHDQTRATGGRRAERVEYEPSAATRERRCAARQPGGRRRGRRSPDRPGSRGSPSSTSARATRSSSRARGAAACSSTAVRIPSRLLVALDARIPPWDRRIDAVILTHPHEDHVAGLALLLERYQRRPRLRAGDARAGAGLRGVAARPGATGRAGPARARGR